MVFAQTPTHPCPPKTHGGAKKAATLMSQVTQLLGLPVKDTEGGTWNRKLLIKATARYDSVRLGSPGNWEKLFIHLKKNMKN